MNPEKFRENFRSISAEVSKAFVGQEAVLDQTLITFLAGGHILLEGVPGLGKTFLVRTLCRTLDLQYSRIQFTPDLMPSDVTGTNIIVEDGGGSRSFKFEPGPIFTQMLLADEINRATPKTQSSLLEAMQEFAVTSAGTRHKLPTPFCVLATQNPIEMEGTYPLPEAQLDRFMSKVLIGFPKAKVLVEILDTTTGSSKPEVTRILSAEELKEMKALVREVVTAAPVKLYASNVVQATHPASEDLAPDKVKQFVRYGASPRGAQALILTAKVRALMDGRVNVAFEDIEASAVHCLRHRLILNFEGEAEGITTDSVIEEVLSNTPKSAE